MWATVYKWKVAALEKLHLLLLQMVARLKKYANSLQRSARSIRIKIPKKSAKRSLMVKERSVCGKP
jgi:hypothetical protein